MDIWVILAGIVIITLASIPLLKIASSRLIRNRANKAQTTERDPLLASLQPRTPALVYFTSPGCGPCRLTQRPIIEALTADYAGKLQVLTVNIEDDMEAALRWGIMKVPRTFILDHNLRPAITTVGIATRDMLVAQISEAEAQADRPAAPLRIVAGRE